MNGEYLRGEVYWVCLDDSLGYEEKTGRPGVIVSSNGLNEKKEGVTVAFLSTQGFSSPNRPSIVAPKGDRQRVLCDQLRTVDVSRLSKYMFTCDESELTRITGALACTLCIPIPKNEPRVKQDTSVVDSMRAEIDMWRRMYEKTLDQLVEIRVSADVVKKTEQKQKPVIKQGVVESDPGYEEEPKEEKKPKKTEPVQSGIKVNLNAATPKEMMEKLGMSKSLAYMISSYRNKNGLFVSLEELLEVDRFTQNMFERYKDIITVEPVEEPKKKIVNINEANIYALMEAGFSKTVAGRIVHHQKNRPPFRDVEELLEIDGVTNGDLRKIRDRLEV